MSSLRLVRLSRKFRKMMFLPPWDTQRHHVHSHDDEKMTRLLDPIWLISYVRNQSGILGADWIDHVINPSVTVRYVVTINQ